MLTYLHPGILTLTLTNPIWVTKTRLVLQYSADRSSKQYKGMFDTLVKIYRHEGVPGLYKVSHHPNWFFFINERIMDVWHMGIYGKIEQQIQQVCRTFKNYALYCFTRGR